MLVVIHIFLIVLKFLYAIINKISRPIEVFFFSISNRRSLVENLMSKKFLTDPGMVMGFRRH